MMDKSWKFTIPKTCNTNNRRHGHVLDTKHSPTQRVSTSSAETPSTVGTQLDESKQNGTIECEPFSLRQSYLRDNHHSTPGKNYQCFNNYLNYQCFNK